MSPDNSIFSPLGAESESLLFELGEFASKNGMQAFLVGGPVRDLILGRNVFDIDVMIQGDALELAKRLHSEKPFADRAESRKPSLYKKYSTAKLRFDGEVCPGVETIDLASARREFYSGIGAAPECSPGSLEEDLARRDFSINAMALSLAPESRGQIFDFNDGRKDLSSRVLRILHPESFRDDPARLIRAVRFMKRFHFELEVETKKLFGEAISRGYIKEVSMRRSYDELRKIYNEDDWQSISNALIKLGMTEQIDKNLKGKDPIELRESVEGRRF